MENPKKIESLPFFLVILKNPTLLLALIRAIFLFFFSGRERYKEMSLIFKPPYVGNLHFYLILCLLL